MNSNSAGSNQLRNRHIDFSVVQLRLVGLLIIIQLLGRFFVVLTSVGNESPFDRLAAWLMLVNWLPLLPLGVSLYLLGGGHMRLKRETQIIPLLCHSLRYLALVFVGILPAALAWMLNIASNSTVNQMLSPYEQELISPMRALTAIVMCILTGIGFALLHHQIQSFLKQHKDTMQSFFRSRRVQLKTGSQI